MMHTVYTNGTTRPAITGGKTDFTILSHHIAIYIPSVNDNGKISAELREYAMSRCREAIIRLCGGATEWESWGSWQSGNELIGEPVRVMSAFFSDHDHQTITRLLGLCRWLKATLDQERIAIEIDSQLHLI